jgi:hypothetical protein
MNNMNNTHKTTNGEISKNIDDKIMKNIIIKQNFIKKIMNDDFTVYYELKIHEKKIVYVPNKSIDKYFKIKFNCEMVRHPDYIFISFDHDDIYIKILDVHHKDKHNYEEYKIIVSCGIKSEYEHVMIPQIKNANAYMQYGISINKFVKSKFNVTDNQRKIQDEIFNESHVNIFHDYDKNYFTDITKWINDEEYVKIPL